MSSKELNIKTVKELKEFLQTVPDDTKLLTWSDEDWEMYEGEVSLTFDSDSKTLKMAVR